MATRERKSAVTALPNRRAPPPDGLTPEEAARWQSVVRALPGDWFNASDLPILAAYCQTIVQHEAACKALQGELLVLEAANGRQYRNPLLAIQNTAALRMITIAAKLRLTPSSRYDAQKAHTRHNRGPTGKRPWENDDLETLLNS